MLLPILTMTTKKNFLFIVVYCVVSACAAQGELATIDSLLYDSQFDLAISRLDNSLKMTSNHEERIILENKKAEALIRAGKFDEAELQLEAIALKPLSADQQVATQANRGFLFLNQGRNDLALMTLQDALANIEKQNKQNTLEAAQILAYLGNLYLATGKYSQAEAQLRMALSIRENLVAENSELIAASYNDLGLVYSTTDANQALDHYEKALAIYQRIHGNDHAKIAIANTNIGFVYRSLEFFGDAINNFESALSIWEKIYPGSHPTKAFIYFNLGQTYLRMKNDKAAGEYYQKALTMYRQSYGNKHPGIATVLNAIGNLKLSSGHFDESIEYFQHALISNVSDFNESNENYNPGLQNYYSGNTLLFSLLNKAEALEARHFGKSLKFDEFKLALKTLLLCDSLINELRQQITNESDKILLGAIATDVYAAGVRIMYEAAQVAASKKTWSEWAFYFAEKSKSAVLLEAISDSNAKSFSGIPVTLLEEEKNLKAEIAMLAQKLSLKPTDSEEKYLREMHFKLNRKYENFVRELEAKFPAYYNLKFNVYTPSIHSLQKRLNESTAIISYFIDEKNNRLYIFEILHKSFKTTSRSIPADFERNLNALRNSLTYNEFETYKRAAEKLSDVLLPAKIPSAVKNLVLIPTGRLSIIPFETLFHKKIKKENSYETFPYLVKKLSVRYEFSAAIFLCAPVSFDRDGLTALPGSESEVKEISNLFTSKNLHNKILTHQEAEEKAVKHGDLKNFRYVHFATHGVVDESSPELSRIYLHTSSTEEDGNLYAGEIYNLELNANLVTLSACQTGLGKISKGEGVIGLSRALVYAGSENIIVSFWSVADQSTAGLMKNFYKYALSSSFLDFGAALRQAKLNLMQESAYASPYYWAPFILIGF
jgi:CHAT domain-containing protein/tetratricopeptide (TPR) repeat protein